MLIASPKLSGPPVGIAYVLADLKKHHIPYEYIDLEFTPLPEEAIRAGEYLCIGSGGMVGSWKFFHEFFAKVKGLSDTPLILGGPVTSCIQLELIFSQFGVDYIFLGEAEKRFAEFLTRLDRQEDVTDLPGLAWRNSDGVIMANRHVRRLDISKYDVSPEWTEVHVERHFGSASANHNLDYPIYHARGCIGNCTFCFPLYHGFTARKTELVILEMQKAVEAYPHMWGFSLMNETSFVRLDQAVEFCEAYKLSGIGKPWNCCLKGNIDLQILQVLKDAGCVHVFMGIESGNDDILKRMRKGITTKMVLEFYKAANLAGILTTGAIMFGSEGETEKHIQGTADFIIENDLYCTFFSMVTAYPGTAIYQRALRRGLISDEVAYLSNLEELQCEQGLHNGLLYGKTKNYDRINVSEVDDSRLYSVVMQQMRRINTHYLEKFTLQNFDPDTGSGECPFCASQVKVPLSPFPLVKAFCSQCRMIASVNYFQYSPLSRQAEMLSAVLRDKNIVVYGRGENARILRTHNLFGVEQGQYVCHVDGPTKDHYYFENPIVSIGDLGKLKYDVILLADAVPWTRKMLSSRGIPEETILDLLPPEWMQRISCLYSAQTGTLQLLPVDPGFAAHALGGACGLKSGDRIVLAPAGRYAISVAENLEELGLDVLAFIDNAKGGRGLYHGKAPILLPMEAGELDGAQILVATPSIRAMQELRMQIAAEIPGSSPICLVEALFPKI
ncbi:B12-binding domain-containing radical SAM protein [Fundidesulfovibrio magnetotacticus]|uniref:B12-binding domain-containing radical SAM protein n=1 Tax=Fundidesulfovibrio magnetotacticus TaxID=2730080 RepID=UPI001F35FBE2|nr:radical SAM protein [Fundidesulfovibrio magnetotacticus]